MKLDLKDAMFFCGPVGENIETTLKCAVKCDCGAVSYEDFNYCPSCGKKLPIKGLIVVENTFIKENMRKIAEEEAIRRFKEACPDGEVEYA